MARDHAQIRLGIWADDDFRTLSGNAQHLYFLLLTSPSLSYCGVTAWRPAKMTGLVGDWTVDTIEEAAAELIERLYIVVDEATEEVLVRSFVRNDGLMKQPKMATAMSTAHLDIGSVGLRSVVVWELQRLHREQPDLPGWNSEKAAALLSSAAVNPSTYPCGKGSIKGSGKGSGKGNSTPTVKGSSKGSPTPSSLLLAPAPAPETSSPSARKRATTAPDDFVITDAMTEWALSKNIVVDLAEETERFLDHHRAKGSTFSNWIAAWRTWMSRTADYANVRALRSGDTARRRQQILVGPDQWRDVTTDEWVPIGSKTRWVSA